MSDVPKFFYNGRLFYQVWIDSSLKDKTAKNILGAFKNVLQLIVF